MRHLVDPHTEPHNSNNTRTITLIHIQTIVKSYLHIIIIIISLHHRVITIKDELVVKSVYYHNLIRMIKNQHLQTKTRPTNLILLLIIIITHDHKVHLLIMEMVNLMVRVRFALKEQQQPPKPIEQTMPHRLVHPLTIRLVVVEQNLKCLLLPRQT